MSRYHINCKQTSQCFQLLISLSRVYSYFYLFIGPTYLWYYAFNSDTFLLSLQTKFWVGGSPGLVLMGGDSCSKGCGFKLRHCILDGHFFTLICCKNCNDVCLKKTENKLKRGQGWPIKKLLLLYIGHQLNRLRRYE